jgi:hypothetical protein
VSLALAAIESDVAVNPDLDISGFIRPQTASWSAHVLFDLFWGGIQACGMTFGTLAQAARIPGLPVDTQNSMALEPSRHK